jgi:adenylate kinase
VAGAVGRPGTLTTLPETQTTAPADIAFLPGPVLLLGAPGVGKGTQAQAIVAEFGIPQISTGDLLRGNIAQGTELGLKAKEIISSGQLVPNPIVNQMVERRLQADDTPRGYILDGYPRTLDQANFLDATLSATNAPLPVVAVSIVVAYEHLLQRITGRRICPTCKSIYNIYFNPPKSADQCDFDGMRLEQRPDDTEPVFAERMKTFEEQTAPVVEHYRALGRFKEVNGDQPVEAVTAEIKSALFELRHFAGKA